MSAVWAVCSGHESGCPCLGCCILNDALYAEAVASVRLSHDPEMQTMSLDDDGTLREAE
jgi:hypothetical protein